MAPNILTFPPFYCEVEISNFGVAKTSPENLSVNIHIWHHYSYGQLLLLPPPSWVAHMGDLVQSEIAQ